MSAEKIIVLLKLKRSYVILSSFLLICSCKKFVQISPPINPIPSSVIFTDDVTATGAVTGIYSEMMNSNNGNLQFTSSGTTLFAGMYADELRFFSPSQRDEFIKNQLTEMSHSIISSLFWARAYKYIYTVNLCMEGLDKSTGVSVALKAQLNGECKFIRAFCYFYLVNLFGDIPMPVSSDFRINANLPRAPASSVYRLILNDLQDAQNSLPLNYSGGLVIRPTKWAATALLARVLLYRHDWVAAEVQASMIIDAGIFHLESDLTNVFLRSSHEAIWQLMPIVPNINTWEGNLIIPPSPNSAPGYLVTNELYNAFENDDQRKTSWLALQNFANQIQYYPFKYKIRNGTIVTEYYTVLRLAEQYLIRAEARTRQNKVAEAQSDINTIRNRAGLPNTNASTPEELAVAIEQECRIEFFAEWGHRWFDLKRTGQANTVMAALKPMTWQATDTLWPIPIDQININPALKQNPGY